MREKIRTVLLFFQLCFLCLLFGEFAFAEMSNDEKRAFIESLAEPLEEKRIFFRWEPKNSGTKFNEFGEATPESNKHFTTNVEAAGSGIYVSKDLFSSSANGDTLIQVEVPPGYKFLNVDPSTMEKLKENGITTLKELYRLNPKVVVWDENHPAWYVLKETKGVKFKPFSPSDLSIDTLKMIYSLGKERIPMAKYSFDDHVPQERRDFYIGLVRKEMVRRTENSSALAREFIKLIAIEHGGEKVRDVVNRYSPHAETLEEASGWLDATKYLSETDERRIVETIIAKEPPITSSRETVHFLIRAKEYLSKSDVNKILERTPIDSLSSASDILRLTRDYPSGYRKKIIERILTYANSEEYLEELKENLSKSEYRRALKRVRGKKKASNKMAARLRCLREWLAKP